MCIHVAGYVCVRARACVTHALRTHASTQTLNLSFAYTTHSACSCNSPADKLATFEECMHKAKSSESGSFCLATLFTQLPPDFVEQAIEKANQPAGASEHYTQIFSACGGGENGTAIVSSCLEQVEYCVRPIQGHPGTFPQDYTKFQSLCACFREPEVLAQCGPEDDVELQQVCMRVHALLRTQRERERERRDNTHTHSLAPRPSVTTTCCTCTINTACTTPRYVCCVCVCACACVCVRHSTHIYI